MNRFISFLGNLFRKELFNNLIFLNFFPVFVAGISFTVLDHLNPPFFGFEQFFFIYVPLCLIFLNFFHSLVNKQYGFYKNILLMLFASIFEILLYLLNAIFIESINPTTYDKFWGWFIVYLFMRIMFVIFYSLIVKIVLVVIEIVNQRNESIN